MFTLAGDLKLDGLRVNQLKLCKQLSGSLSLSEHGLHLHARGQRSDEALDLDLAPGILRMPASMGQPAGGGEPGAEAGLSDASTELHKAGTGFSYGNYDVDSPPAGRAATRQLAGGHELCSYSGYRYDKSHINPVYSGSKPLVDADLVVNVCIIADIQLEALPIEYQP